MAGAGLMPAVVLVRPDQRSAARPPFNARSLPASGVHVMASANKQTDGINDRDPPTFVPDGGPGSPPPPGEDVQLAAGSYRSGGPTKPTSGDWQEAGVRPDANSPGPFNPTQGQTLASKQFDEQDPTFIREGGPRLPSEVQKIAESMKQSGKYEAYDREQVGNIAAAAFNSASGKFTPTDVVQVANGRFVAVGGDPHNPASPRTDPIDPKAAAATPVLQSLAQLNQPQQVQMAAQTNDIESPAHRLRSA